MQKNNSKPNSEQGSQERQGEPNRKPLSAVEESKEILNKIKQEKEELKEWTERAEATRAERILSGDSDAGQQQEAPKEESDKEYTDRILKGEVKDGEIQTS